MEKLTRDYAILARLIFVFRIFGLTFIKLKKLCLILRRFVLQSPHERIKAKLSGDEEAAATEFAAQCESLNAIYPEVAAKDEKELRKVLHGYGIDSNIPTGYLLMTNRQKCRCCGKELSVENKPHNLMVYDLKHGPLVGSRMTKICRRCDIHEHCGYWTLKGFKHYDKESLDDCNYLLTSEETAIDIDMLKDVGNLLIVGAVPFSTYASSYNRRFGNEDQSCIDEEKVDIRKGKQTAQELFKRRKGLDRRRLEEAFIVYASLDLMRRHNFEIEHFPYDKSELTKLVVICFHSIFVSKWSEHSCQHKGCKNVVVIDGNMKNCRQVCSCKGVTQLQFEGMIGAITVGCLNTPAKGLRLCKDHSTTSIAFRDDENLMNEKQCDDKDDKDDLLPLSVINERETRSGKFFEIKWNDGRCTWVKESNLPAKFLENSSKIHIVDVDEVGQKRMEYTMVTDKHKENDKQEKVFESHGFAVENYHDNYVEDEDGSKLRSLICGTEKGKHKCKNAKTAGILVFERPCGVVIDVRELFGSESKSQVYGHLHQLMTKEHMSTTEVICYDDACHLKKFCKNPVRSNDTKTSRELAQMEMVCDRFHFKNHTDKWCRRNCNPYNCNALKLNNNLARRIDKQKSCVDRFA
ncbi:hypothetical protein AC249_AIPGENE27746 [Exaiptasia diaphana]|nr:hypothetical protein AC249_AIPGENE27746 [Exaiptasia diaphana]